METEEARKKLFSLTPSDVSLFRGKLGSETLTAITNLYKRQRGHHVARPVTSTYYFISLGNFILIGRSRLVH